MSLIHEALERLEREKEEKATGPAPHEILEPAAFEPSLKETVVSREIPQPRRENHRLIYGLSAALVTLFIFALVYLLVGTFHARLPKENVAVSSRLAPVQGRFVLTGINLDGDDSRAVINNELVRVGDSVGGARVRAIGDQEVVLEGGGGEITLQF